MPTKLGLVRRLSIAHLTTALSGAAEAQPTIRHADRRPLERRVRDQLAAPLAVARFRALRTADQIVASRTSAMTSPRKGIVSHSIPLSASAEGGDITRTAAHPKSSAPVVKASTIAATRGSGRR